MPEDIINAIIAAGGNSRGARSARARKQLRDRYGRWIEMGGGLNFKFRMPNGDIVSVVGRSVGGSDNSEDGVQVYVPASDRPDIREGFYTVPASNTETAQALLSEEQLKRAGIDADTEGGTLDAGVIDFNDAVYSEAPEGWTKRPSGSYTTEDGYSIEQNEDGKWEVLQDEVPLSSHDDLGSAFADVADRDAEAELPEADKKKVADLRSQGNEDAAKKVVRNEPVAMLSEEKAAEVTIPGFDYKEGDAFDLKDLDKVPAGGRIDYKHTIKSADGNDRLIENSYQKNEDGSWTKLDDDSNATVLLRREANSKDQIIGDYTYKGVSKPEQVAELPATEALINEDVATMTPEELKAARQDALDKIAAERALPEDDQDPDLLDSLGERITDITIRENEIAGLTPTVSPADNIAGWLEANGGGNGDGGDTTPPPAADTPNESGADLLAQFMENNKNWNDAYKRSRDETLSQEERDAAIAEIADIRAKNAEIDKKLSELFKSDFASAEAVIEFYDENDEDRSLLSWDDVRESLGGEDWLLNAPAGSKAIYYDTHPEGGEFDVLTRDEDGNWVGSTYSMSAEELIEENKRGTSNMRLVAAPRDEAPAEESDAERVARIYKDHEAIPASDFQVGDDSNSSFLKEAPIGSEVSYRKDMEDSEGPYEATIKFTKTGDDEWTASGDDSVEGEKFSADELSTDRDTYTIDKIAGEEQVAELPSGVTEEEYVPELGMDIFEWVAGEKFLNDSPIGSEIHGMLDGDPESAADQVETFTRTAENEWTRKSDGKKFTNAELAGAEGNFNGSNQDFGGLSRLEIGKIVDEGGVAEAPAPAPAPVSESLAASTPRSNVYGDTNDLPTLERRLAQAEMRLERAGNDVHGEMSDDRMAQLEQQIVDLQDRIDAINNGEEFPVDQKIENVKDVAPAVAETETPEKYEAAVTKLAEADKASEQTKVATDLAVEANKSGDKGVADAAAEVVEATKVYENAETTNTDPQYKKKLSAFAAKLLERLSGALDKEEEKQRKAAARKDVKAIASSQRRIEAINRTLAFMNLKTDEVDGYDPRGTREYVINNTTIDKSSIEYGADGNLISAEGVYVAPTGEVYRMVWSRKDGKSGTYAYLVNDFTDPKTGRVWPAGSPAGSLSMHFDDSNPESDGSPVIMERSGIPELDGGTRYFIPGYIHAAGADPHRRIPTPFKTIGAGMHGWSAAMANLDNRRYQHSSWLFPNGRAASHRFHDKQVQFHSRSQREKFFDLLNAPTSKMMRKLGYHKGREVNGLKAAWFNRDMDGKLSSDADPKVWWGEFDRYVDTPIAKFALVMRKRFKDNPDAVAGVDYPKFLETYIKGDDHTKIEQLSLADALYTLNYEGGDRSAVAARLRSVLDELKAYADKNGSTAMESEIRGISGNWNPASNRSIRVSIDPAITVLSDVTAYLENPSNKLDKPLPAAESVETVFQDIPSGTPTSQIEELPKLVAPPRTTNSDALFDTTRADADRIRDLNATFTEQEIKDGLENAIKRNETVGRATNGTDNMSATVADFTAALNERGIDDYRFVAEVYDRISGGTQNVDALDAFYERNKDMLPEAPASAPQAGYVLAPLQRNESFEGLKYAMDPAPYEPVGTDTEGTSDDPTVIANSFTPIALRESFINALTSGDSQVRLQFPGQNGEKGPEANVAVEAVRDALQLRGVDTNHVAEIVAGESDIEVVNVPDVADGLPATPASIGSTPNPDTSVSVPSTDNQADLTANPSTGTVTAADVDLDETDGVDAYDPEVIMQVIRNRYPNAEEMANGDLILSNKMTTDADGNTIEFQVVVVRTRQEFFYTYIRRINHAETDPSKKYQSLRYGRMSQSARALNNTINDARARVNTVSERHGSNTMNRWWGEPGQRGRVQQENINPDTNQPEHVREQPIDRETVQRIVAATSDEAVSEAMVLGIFRHITQHGASQTVLNRLRSTFGMTRESMNTIVDSINELVAKQDRIRRFDTWVSGDGETPLFEGDIVIHPSTGRRGVVVRRIIEHRTHDYGYSDYLYVQFEGERSQRNITSRKLQLVQTSGGTNGSERRGPGAIQLPDPTLTVRAQNRMRREGRIHDFAPEQLQTDRFSGPLPTVTIDGNTYPVRGSRQTVIGDNMDALSGDLSTAQVGDFTATLDPTTGALRVREIVGIEQNEDGTVTVFTFLPTDFGSGIAEGTTYTPNEDGLFGRSVAVYRQRPTEDTGLATQRDREALGTAVSEADPAAVSEEIKTRVADLMDPASTATPREVNDTAVEISQLPKKPEGAVDSVPLAETQSILSDVKAEAPGDSTINLDNIEAAGNLQGATPDEKMADAPAWFKNPMTPEAVEEKMGPAETPAAPVEMPAPTTPFEELPEEAPTPEAEAPRDIELIRGEIVDVEGQLVRARSARDAMGDDPIVTGAIDNRIDELEARFSELEAELAEATPTAPQSGEAVDGAFINGSPVGTEITTVVNGQKVTFKKNADGTWVTTDIVTIEDMGLNFTPAPVSDEQMAERANTGNVSLG